MPASSSTPIQRAADSNLQMALWEAFEAGAHILVSSGALGNEHSLAAAFQMYRSCTHPLSLQLGTAAPSVDLSRGGVILIGNPPDLPAVALDCLQAAGYPGRFPFEEMQQAEAPRGLVFRGATRDLARRPVLLIAGASAATLHAAGAWALDDCLFHAPAPPGFPRSPVEAMVAAVGHPDRPPAPDLGAGFRSLRVVAGNYELDQRDLVWKENRTRVRVLTEGEEIRIIYLGEHKVPVTGKDMPRLLVALIKRKWEGAWSTIDDLQKMVHAKADPSKHDTIKARLSEIRALARDPDFVEFRNTELGVRQYRLRAQIQVEKMRALSSENG